MKPRVDPSRPGLVIYAPEPEYAGRPPNKYTRELHDQIVNYLRAGVTRDRVGPLCGITRATFEAWCNRGRSGDPYLVDFYEDVEQAIAFSISQVAAVVHKAAVDGNLEAGKFILSGRDAHNFGKQVRLQVESQMTAFLEACEQQLPPHVYEQVLEIALSTTGAGALEAAPSREEESVG